MRGKPLSTIQPSGRVRNIPAYAGKTVRNDGGASRSSEHPRVCGENWVVPPNCPTSWGTSPRMRGKRRHSDLSGAYDRNIPAYAGKTNPRVRFCVAGPEHPRVCGENVSVSGAVIKLKGTSPRMRGKPEHPCFLGLLQRNIPAYAGKTTTTPSMTNPCSEHPRVCGENRLTMFCRRSFCGTSPRMRGKPQGKLCLSVNVRNIPAYAGKTEAQVLLHEVDSEHPRVCGENGFLG